ncbi:cytochrome c oxidase assembly protein [Cellulomonas fimi]|uniref:Cytochrome c oxidase caa3-type, assembly factor CtaG-related protein n=1 Tax=Cellulomonas fimi (strain ATCC 484 / DSM 20113 / JCM 1341 / CCUG 24087 / LMG 16345 / NBRC 15513 / NCIMB 8980 / NCTC 7547 / NRS-133) TaxID=590998 RepID=F4H692_CELFA|nr:cytochrome c oxidase assembly protein [Cellulomonas fimi]AEE44404.1 Cytochrome c oxidase caa3-type, assembly factor CtaG-related protein [Cellulomonas fimi ATCC 484]NNH08296.1 bifunctional copper resistance protein CopD/cytochrome c oxidase assembly protein [Cellulomonas fimi]VEH26294.1 Putative copper export protein [Cellulomonas fimi]
MSSTPVRGGARTPGAPGPSDASPRPDGVVPAPGEDGADGRRAGRPVATRVAVLLAAALVCVVAGIAFTGAVAPRLVADPGAAVRWGLPVATTVSELAGAVALGALFLAVCVLPRRVPAAVGAARVPAPGTPHADGRAYPRSLLVAAWAAGAWTLASLAHLVVTYANVAGRAVGSAQFGQELGVFVTEIELGRTLLLVTTAAAVVTVLSLVVATPTGAAWTAVVVLVALYQQAQLGHAAGASGHDLATSSMVVHLVGAAIWVGALAALAVLVRWVGTDLSASVARYSVVAGWCLVAVAGSGLVNGLLRTAGWSDLTTSYGVLLLVKVALLGALGLLGLAHRRAVIPRLAGGASGTSSTAGGLFWRLVLVELAVMGAVSGVAVALGATAPPVPEEPPADPSPAYRLTGHPLPPEPTTLRWLTEWRWDLLLAGAALAGLVVYWRWVLRLRRRGDSWPWLRTASWTVGLLLFAWTTSGAPALYGHVLFSAHMIQHMVLAMVVPIFIALSAPVTLALRALPVRSTRLRDDASRGPREWILVLVHSRVGSFLAHPLVAAVNFAGSMVLFYYTGLFEWSLRSPVGHLAMVVHFSAAGYLFVNSLVGVDPGPTRLAYPQRLLTLFATMAFHAFFGVALVSGETLLVADWFGLMGRPWGPSALADQQVGGAITWGIGEIPTLALAIGVGYAWARDDERTARRRDRRVDREGDVELDEYNAMLSGLAARDGGRPAGPAPQTGPAGPPADASSD